MHELSIALSIMDIVVEQAKKHKAVLVEKVQLEVGKLAGVDLESLQFSLDMAKQQYGCPYTAFHIHVIEPEYECDICQSTFHSDSLFTGCPVCKATNVSMLKGRELKVKSLIIK